MANFPKKTPQGGVIDLRPSHDTFVDNERYMKWWNLVDSYDRASETAATRRFFEKKTTMTPQEEMMGASVQRSWIWENFEDPAWQLKHIGLQERINNLSRIMAKKR